ncbi:MAG: Fe-S biogenesis protein NfuA [Pantoea sp. Brub]|nr:Fe-S biogenesis protein NfuA [Pantoea sp. Brub]
MIVITKAAEKYFLTLLAKQKNGTQIRIFITNPGTSKAECEVAYCSPNNITKTDKKLKFGQLYVYIDEISAPYLEKAEIDFIVDDLESQLVLKVPKIKSSNELTESSIFKRIQYFLYSQISPQLLTHGGYVSLIEINNDGYVVLEFKGGCNGCSMINITVKNHIERELLLHFPEIKGVIDITEHKRNMHSYY